MTKEELLVELEKLWFLLGPAGLALVFLSSFALYFALRNGLYLFLVGRDFKRRFYDFEIKGEEYLRSLYNNSANPLVGIIVAIVHTHARHSDDIRAEVAYMFHRNFASVLRGLAYLRLISVLAPLLGLLGTMFGMVTVFSELGQAKATVDPAMLARGIGEALMTTILGLCVAIPTLVIYYHLNLKVRGFRIEAVEHSYRALELCGGPCSIPETAPETSGADRNEAQTMCARFA